MQNGCTHLEATTYRALTTGPRPTLSDDPHGNDAISCRLANNCRSLAQSGRVKTNRPIWESYKKVWDNEKQQCFLLEVNYCISGFTGSA